MSFFFSFSFFFLYGMRCVLYNINEHLHKTALRIELFPAWRPDRMKMFSLEWSFSVFHQACLYLDAPRCLLFYRWEIIGLKKFACLHFSFSLFWENVYDFLWHLLSTHELAYFIASLLRNLLLLFFFLIFDNKSSLLTMILRLPALLNSIVARKKIDLRIPFFFF